MDTTIFCTFDHQDLADLAMGHIRAVHGVKTIHYVYDRNTRREGHRTAGAVNSTDSNGFGWGFTNMGADLGHPREPLPVSMKITCSTVAKNTVVSRLVNQHASHIIVTPR